MVAGKMSENNPKPPRITVLELFGGEKVKPTRGLTVIA